MVAHRTFVYLDVGDLSVDLFRGIASIRRYPSAIDISYSGERSGMRECECVFKNWHKSFYSVTLQIDILWDIIFFCCSMSFLSRKNRVFCV